MAVHKKISFHYLTDPFFLENRTKLKNFIVYLINKEKNEVETINYVFCTDSYLLELNRKHLLHDTLTDTITFPLSNPPNPIIADIFISVDRVRENA